MTKMELIDAMAKSAKISKRAAGDALNAMTASITKSLKAGKPVTLVGFGTFKAVKRAARMGMNPRTGQKIKISARTAPTFKAGAGLKKAVA